MNRLATWSIAALLTVFVVGCSDDDTDPPAGGDAKITTEKGVVQKDSSGLPDGYILYSCTKVGKSCNAHDPCALDPICGKDKKCHPSGLQNCNDNLKCTLDTCAGLGVCDNKPTGDTCALPIKVKKGQTCADVRTDGGVKSADAGVADAGLGSIETIICCFKKGDSHPTDPCLKCIPEVSDDAGTVGNSKKWSAANGGYCDDNDPCTKDDTCSNGQCRGTSFGSKCSDNLSCTQDLCDGKGACLGNTLKKDWCLINGECFKDGAKHPGGSCFFCDVKTSQKNWTTIANSCFIGGKCYKPNEKDTTNCGICDPKKSTTQWTMLKGLCKIGGKCYTKGSQHVGKCAECDPASSTTTWTVKGQYCLIADKCNKPKDKDATGCSACAPQRDKYGWSQLPGLCQIDGKCYSKGIKHTGGCAECDPKVSSIKWTVKGSYCYINKACKNPGNKDATGCGVCDPKKDMYGWSTVANSCLIANKCYTKGVTDSTGCGSCDPSKNSTGWTVTGNKCLIAGTCHNSGVASPTGCGSCVPTTSKSAWTPAKGKCLIQGSCYTDKASHSSGCLVCNYAKSPTAWTAAGSTKLQFWGFEKAAAGWAIKNSTTSVGWQVSSLRTAGGSYALYYGNPTTKNYNTGAKNNGTATSPTITLAGGKKAGLSFMLWMSTETTSSYDKLTVSVNSTVVWQKNLPTTNITMLKWTPIYVDLSKYAGQSIAIKFDFDTMDSVSNSTEGIYVDEIYVHNGC